MARIGRFLVPFEPEAWEYAESDFLVVGSGIGGLFTALKASDYGAVAVLTKQRISDTNTSLAQGGIAVAIDDQDSPSLHWEDTLAAGAGLCEEDAVRVLVNEGPARVGELIRMGARFDSEGGSMLFAREGAHSRPRVIHARDATGYEIQRTLVEQCRLTPEITIHENCQVVDLLLGAGGRCVGVLAREQSSGRLTAYLARVVVLATGGAGQLFRYTTNPSVATGDGMAAAYRAGAQLMDLEFVQFHPTALAVPGAPPLLISEAVRGEGGRLVNDQGERFMFYYHPQGELAPRDVVARAIWQELNEGKTVYLDMTHLGEERLQRRFPNIVKRCAEWGIDVASQPVPVAPAAHYTMGGIRTDSWGRTSILGLFSCGEAACNGVHGANRLASNSLLDGLVFGDRIVRVCREEWREIPRWTKKHLLAVKDWKDSFAAAPFSFAFGSVLRLFSWSSSDGYRVLNLPVNGLDSAGAEKKIAAAGDKGMGELEKAAAGSVEEMILFLQTLMWEEVGLVRSEAGLKRCWELLLRLEELVALRLREDKHPPGRLIELANMVQLGQLVALAALARQESRGAHYRVDFPRPNDQEWRRHLIWQQAWM